MAPYATLPYARASKAHRPTKLNLQNLPCAHARPGEVYAESYEKAGDSLEAALEHVPVLQEAGVKSSLHGPDTHSTDHGFVLGRIWDTENVFVAPPGAGLRVS